MGLQKNCFVFKSSWRARIKVSESLWILVIIYIVVCPTFLVKNWTTNELSCNLQRTKRHESHGLSKLGFGSALCGCTCWKIIKWKPVIFFLNFSYSLCSLQLRRKKAQTHLVTQNKNFQMQPHNAEFQLVCHVKLDDRHLQWSFGGSKLSSRLVLPWSSKEDVLNCGAVG